MTGPGWWALALVVALIAPIPLSSAHDMIQRARHRRTGAASRGMTPAASEPPPVAVLDTADHIWHAVAGPCWHCEQITHWVDLAFEAPLHPGECSRAKWREWAAATCR